MKNIHVLPTDKPSNLLLCIKSYIEHKDTPAENSDNKGNFRLGFGIYANTEFYQHQNIYITSNEEIKRGDCILVPNSEIIILPIGLSQVPLSNFSRGYSLSDCKKIILTTDQDLIKDGVQSIDDEFLEWFVENPSCEFVEVIPYLKSITNPITNEDYSTVQYRHFDLNKMICKYKYKIIIPKEEPKQETLEEAAHQILVDYGVKSIGESIGVLSVKKLMVKMAQHHAEKMYSEEDIINALHSVEIKYNKDYSKIYESMKEWFNKFKKK